MHAPQCFFVFHLYKQSSGDSRIALEMEHAVNLHRHDPTVTRARTSLMYNRPFHLGSTIVAAFKTALARYNPHTFSA
jgi:hypothetical protein